MLLKQNRFLVYTFKTLMEELTVDVLELNIFEIKSKRNGIRHLGCAENNLHT